MLNSKFTKEDLFEESVQKSPGGGQYLSCVNKIVTYKEDANFDAG